MIFVSYLSILTLMKKFLVGRNFTDDQHKQPIVVVGRQVKYS